MPASDTQPTTWETIKSELQDLFAPDVFEMWFKPLDCASETEGSLTIAVPNDFSAFWIQDNYMDLIARQAEISTGRALKIELAVAPREGQPLNRLESPPDTRRMAAERPQLQPKPRERSMGFQLNPRNSFENFVVGPTNQLAHAACVAVANAPARAYNPLFLYGETGLGKTHLMQAVAQSVLKNNVDARIAYLSSEKFTNEFIHAIQGSSLAKFRQRYRNVDVLLIDDIQFLSGKEGTQEEFFHTFNDLFESGRQICLTSDRPASEIAKLESRLVSRFQWGLVTDVQSPDFETRSAILAQKVRDLKVPVSEEIIEFLAKRVSRNVRRMEGALTRVTSYVKLTRKSLDLPTVERLLGDILQEEAQSEVTIEAIQKKVAQYYNLRLGDMTSRRRPANIAFPRQIAMYLSRNLTGQPLQAIGEVFGGRDHGTVIHAVRNVKNIMEQDPSVRRSVEYLESTLARPNEVR
ncbi:MAG: chromosomal replication initiator protein DnaA [Verrucomicrobiota bacterium]